MKKGKIFRVGEMPWDAGPNAALFANLSLLSSFDDNETKMARNCQGRKSGRVHRGR